MSQQQVNLSTVLKDRSLLVKDYQRPYAWGDKQLQDLWEDLDLLGSGTPHYAGTLVLKPTHEPPTTTSTGESLAPFEVVDGQQRLTTCLLLLDRLRRRLAGLAESEDALEYAKALHQTYGVVKVNGVLKSRLVLAKDLQEVWLDEILGDQVVVALHEIAGVRRLREAASFFEGQLDALVAEVADEVALTRLKDLHLRITQGLRFVVYEVESASEVGVIFETLNERGRALTELEKVKNYLLYLARQLPEGQREDLANTINAKWSLIFSNLSEGLDITEEVLRAHWLATRDPIPRNWQRIRSVKDAFPRSKYVAGSDRLAATHEDDDQGAVLQQLYDDVTRYVEELEQCSVFARDMIDDHPAYSMFNQADAERARVAMGSLRRTGIVAIFRPLLFAARLTHPHDGDLYASMVEMCVAYAARVFIIAQRRGNAGLPYIASIANELYKGADVAASLSQLRDRLWVYAPDTLVQERLAATDNWYVRTGAHKYLLYEYELHLNKGAKGVPDYRTFFDSKHGKSTEHILPQTPERNEAGFVAWKAFSAEEHQLLHNTLGNLVLTNENSNSSYGRKAYVDKRGVSGQDPTKPCYFNGKLAQERQVAETYDHWSPATIMARQEVLAAWAMERFAVEAPDSFAMVEQQEAADELDAWESDEELT